MNLFDGAKSTAFKVVNAILLLWLIGSLILGLSGIASLLFFPSEKKEMTLERYTAQHCYLYEENVKPTPELCKEDWLLQKDYLEEPDFWDVDSKETIVDSVISLVIVGAAMLIINWPRKKK